MAQSSLMAWLRKPPSQNITSRNESNTPPVEPIPTGSNGPQEISLATAERGESEAIAGAGISDNVEFRACRREDLPHLKRLTSILLPIPYPDKFYKEIIEDEVTNSITLLALWHDNPAARGHEQGCLVGAIRCRLLAHPPTAEQTARREGPMLYLSTLVLLSPYRGHGIATRMLEILTKRAVDEYGVTTVGAHVWDANEEGQEWYRKRGFKEVAREPHYYPRLSPRGAVVLQRNVSVLDFT